MNQINFYLLIIVIILAIYYFQQIKKRYSSKSFQISFENFYKILKELALGMNNQIILISYKYEPNFEIKLTKYQNGHKWGIKLIKDFDLVSRDFERFLRKMKYYNIQYTIINENNFNKVVIDFENNIEYYLKL